MLGSALGGVVGSMAYLSCPSYTIEVRTLFRLKWPATFQEICESRRRSDLCRKNICFAVKPENHAKLRLADARCIFNMVLNTCSKLADDELMMRNTSTVAVCC